MKILVTGVCGLIGSHLAEKLLKQGYNVVGVDDLSFGTLDNIKNIKEDKNFKFIKHDLKIPFINLFNDIDIIYHLAAFKKAPPSKSEYREGTNNLLKTSCNDVMINNSKMMENIIDYIKQINPNIKLLYTSSSDVYSNHKDFLESSPVEFGPPTIERYSYALSKWFEEQLVLNAYNEGSIKATVARIFGCYSERSKIGWSAGHVLIFIDKALKNEDIIIHGDGLQTRSMSHVFDIVNGLIAMIDNFDSVNGEILNLGSAEEISILDTAKMIVKMLDSKSKIKFIEAEKVHGKGYKDIQRRYADTTKAKKLIGYKTTIKLKEGIELTTKQFITNNDK